MAIATPPPGKSNTSRVDRRAAVVGAKRHRQLAGAGHDEIGRAVLVADRRGGR